MASQEAMARAFLKPCEVDAADSLRIQARRTIRGAWVWTFWTFGRVNTIASDDLLALCERMLDAEHDGACATESITRAGDGAVVVSGGIGRTRRVERLANRIRAARGLEKGNTW